MRQNLQTHTGNRIVVEFDGKKIGAVQSARINDSYGLDDVSGIGDIHVIEHVPTKATHTVSVSNMVLFNKSMRRAGLVPENGDDALKGMVFDLVAYSKDTGEMLRKAIGCSYDSGDISIDAHRVVMASASFKALDVAGMGV